MAHNSDTPLERAKHQGLNRPDAGMCAPEGYFDNFAARMEAALPHRDEIETHCVAQKPRTFWQAVRPYVYMAAMFAGIWCMLQMFHAISGKHELAPMEKNPVLADAFAAENFLYDFVDNDMSAREIVDEMADDGVLDYDLSADELGREILSGDDSAYILPQ